MSKKYFLSILPIAFIVISCTDDNFFKSKKSSENTFLLKQARLCLYENNLDKSDSLLNLIDSLDLAGSDLGFYFLTKGFLYHKNGETKKSIKFIEKASNIFSKHGSDEEKAELNLIWGLIYEDTNLPSKAAESFFEGLKYYQDKDSSKIQLYLFLGLARTASEKDYFLNKAEEILPKLNDRNASLLYYKTKAYIKVEIQERHLLYLKTLNDFEDLFDPRGKINLYGSLALDCQILEKNDSANYYLEKAKEILSENAVSHLRLIHYFFIKAYIDMKSGRLIEAVITIDSTIALAQNQLGLLSQAYLRKSNIESVKKNYAQANISLLQHLKYEKENLKSMQDNQIALMTIGYKLDHRQVELLKVRNFWLMIVIGLLLGFLILGTVFFINKRRNYKEKQALKDLISLTSAEKYEIEKKYRITRDKLLETTDESKGKLHIEPLKNKEKKHSGSVIGDFRNWNHFRSDFIYRNPLYFDKLKKNHPELKALDFKYCFCFLSKLTNQQTADLLEVTYDAVKKAKRKLKDKFQLNSVQELPIYLESINQQITDF